MCSAFSEVIDGRVYLLACVEYKYFWFGVDGYVHWVMAWTVVYIYEEVVIVKLLIEQSASVYQW